MTVTPRWFNLEAERLDVSYRTGKKLTPEQLHKALLREQALAAYPSVARADWNVKYAVKTK